VQTDLLLYALVAAGLVFWLKSVLGTRHGDERERPNPFTAAKPTEGAAEPAAQKDGVVTLPLESSQRLPRNTSFASEEAEQGLFQVAQQMPGFDLARFAQAAQDAFVMIVEAFANGDRTTLKDLLEPQVYNAFEGAIALREQKGECMQTEIHAVRRAEILSARVENKTAYVTLRFVADETCVVRDKDGVLLSGDPERITEMNDIWTFSRPLQSRDLMWFLHETRDGHAQDSGQTPVPDVH
jgi:predicted lipid-binding transport protein (Tim44 family)